MEEEEKEEEEEEGEGDDDSEFLSIKRSVMEDLLAEGKSLYEELLRYEEESAMLFRNLGTAEDKVEERKYLNKMSLKTSITSRSAVSRSRLLSSSASGAN